MNPNHTSQELLVLSHNLHYLIAISHVIGECSQIILETAGCNTPTGGICRFQILEEDLSAAEQQGLHDLSL